MTNRDSTAPPTRHSPAHSPASSTVTTSPPVTPRPQSPAATSALTPSLPRSLIPTTILPTTTSPATLTLTKPPLTPRAHSKSRSSGAANPPSTGTLSGVVNSDNITATYNSAATQASNIGTYPITPTLLDPASRLGNYDVTITNGV